jgi:hypothetical protein
MTEESLANNPGAAPQANPAAGQQQQIQVPIIDTDMQSIYVNFFRVTGNPDEVLMDFGVYSQVIGPNGPEPVHLKHRLIMNYVTAKKLAEVLRVVVQRHEQVFGYVEVDPNRRLRYNPQATAPPVG